MSELYGYQWASSQGVEPTERWVKALSHYDIEKTSKFILMCETGKHYIDYPPSVRDFHVFCKPQHASHKLFAIEQELKGTEKERREVIRNKPQSELPPIPGYEHLQGGAA